MYPLHMLALAPRGTVTVQDAASPGGRRRIVYQNTAPHFANCSTPSAPRLQLRRHVIPTDPRTAPQLTRRAIFAAAVAAWRALSAEEREPWRERGAALELPAYNAFVSDYCRRHSTPSGPVHLDGSRRLDGSWKLDGAPAGPVPLDGSRQLDGSWTLGGAAAPPFLLDGSNHLDGHNPLA